jgi:hypothetical protein
MWTGFIWLRIKSRGGQILTRLWILKLYTRRKISWLSERPFCSRGLCSIELVNQGSTDWNISTTVTVLSLRNLRAEQGLELTVRCQCKWTRSDRKRSNQGSELAQTHETILWSLINFITCGGWNYFCYFNLYILLCRYKFRYSSVQTVQ